LGLTQTGASNGSFNSQTVSGVVANTRRIVVNFSATGIYKTETKYSYNCVRVKDPTTCVTTWYHWRYNAYFVVTLYVYVTGVGWKSWAYNYDPTFGSNGGTGSWTVDTGFQTGDITQFYVNYTWRGSWSQKVFTVGAGDGIPIGSISINNYSSDQVAAAVVDPGVLNWLAIGR